MDRRMAGMGMAHDATFAVPLPKAPEGFWRGADLMAFSGGKAIGGPQGSGILCGGRDLIMSAVLQQAYGVDVDKLLSSAGVFPVYYWFIRGRSTAESPFVREFLVRFEAERRTNRERAAAEPSDKNVDQELLLYDRLNRSTDDVKSHEGRFKILTKRFNKFIQKATGAGGTCVRARVAGPNNYSL